MAKKSYSETDGGNNPRGTKTSTKKSLQRNSENTAVVSWSMVNAELLTFLVHAVTMAGGAIMLGRSSDGGVLTIRVYHDDYDKTAIYIRPTQQEGIDDIVFLADTFAKEAGIASWL